MRLKPQDRYEASHRVHVPINNFPGVRDIWNKDYDAIYKNKKRNLDSPYITLGDNRENFKKIFGKHIQVYDGEVRFHVWRTEFKNITFWLLSDDEIGTSIEAELPYDSVNNPEHDKIVSEFLLYLTKKLYEVA